MESEENLNQTVGHELIRSVQVANGAVDSDRNTALAEDGGEQYATRIGETITREGIDTSDLNSLALVQAGTQRSNQVGDSEVTYRQVTYDEAGVLDQLRTNLASDETLSAEDRQQQIQNLDAVACAAVRCAEGVPENSGDYEALLERQQLGEALLAEGVNPFSEYQEKGLFAYDDGFLEGIVQTICSLETPKV